MATLHYETLIEHKGHDIRVFARYDETAGLECVECHNDIFTADNENVATQEYGIALYPNGDSEVITFETDLGAQINRIVGGHFESVVLRTEHGHLDMWFNEEGKMLGLPVNGYATELFQMYFSNADVIVGNVLLTSGVDKDGNTIGLTQEQVNLFLPNTKEN